jgi:hypothetical protein
VRGFNIPTARCSKNPENLTLEFRHPGGCMRLLGRDPVEEEPMTPNEKAIEAEIQAKGKTAPRITPEEVDQTISATYTCNAYDALVALGVPVDEEMKRMTICFMKLRNGFLITGESVCVSMDNYDPEIGGKVARDKARGKIWELEGYRLRSALHNAA